jgi:hypothetical protein
MLTWHLRGGYGCGGGGYSGHTFMAFWTEISQVLPPVTSGGQIYSYSVPPLLNSFLFKKLILYLLKLLHLKQE